MNATKDRGLRVLVSAGTVGGPGGAQRAVASILRALPEDSVDVVARRQISGGQMSGARRVWDSRHWRWIGSKSASGVNGAVARIVNPARAQLFPEYDVHVRLYQGVNVNRAVRAKVRLLVPSGNQVTADDAHGYDFVALQAPDNVGLVDAGPRLTLLPPPLYPLSDRADQPGTPVPSEFCLTAFNPYGAIKGVDDLERALEGASLPIVWCHTNRGIDTHVPPALREHPMLVHVPDPTPAELRWLYERCAAYLCFSKSEGFGWSIADGLRHAPVVVSRDIGILTHPEARSLSGVVRTETWDLDWSVMPTARGNLPDRDLSFQAPETFRRNLMALVESAP
ncbi:hypothetical protein [Knoellia sp. Soil729]|uniref:hypothetical protein n=1 Tax=Knoellia sp. Soil729 TaxID=1736394 RepID=UPI0006FCA656|nr:hypothetical protein [Knoellia sp. Soil729]